MSWTIRYLYVDDARCKYEDPLFPLGYSDKKTQTDKGTQTHHLNGTKACLHCY